MSPSLPTRRTILSLLTAGMFGLVLGAAGRPATASPVEPQPHMRMALTSLEAAQKHLETADNDKGGHRVKAMEHVRLAMDEVRAGIAFDNKHEEHH